MRFASFVLAYASIASAHFILNWPPSAGFDDDLEPEWPCGGQTPVFNSSTPNITVEQFAVGMSIYHPVGTFLFAVSTATSEPYNFTEIVPIVDTSGLGTFCLTGLSAPSDLVGKSAVLQIIDYSDDGMLHQCAPVNFVAGANTTAGPTCTNATSFSATWTSQENSSVASTTAASGSPSTATATTSTHSGAAAMVTGFGSVLGLGLLAAGLAL